MMGINILLAALGVLAGVNAVSDHTFRHQIALDANGDGDLDANGDDDPCETAECDTCLDNDCVWVKTGSTYADGKCRKKGLLRHVYNGGLTRRKYEKDTYESTIATCRCAEEIHGTPFAGKCQSKKFMEKTYGKTRLLARTKNRQVHFANKQTSMICRKQHVFVIDASLITDRGKPQNSIYPAKFDGESVVVKEVPDKGTTPATFGMQTSHSYIAPFKGRFKDMGPWSMVYGSCGTLMRDFIVDATKQANTDLPTRLNWLSTIAQALQYLHVHHKSFWKNICPSNIFVGCADGCKKQSIAKLVDLSGSATIQDTGKRNMGVYSSVTAYWKANYPTCNNREILREATWTAKLPPIKKSPYTAPEASDKTEYGVQADVFSFGKIMKSLLVKDTDNQAQAKVHPGDKLKVTKEMKDLITACTKKDPFERPCISHVLGELEQMIWD